MTSNSLQVCEHCKQPIPVSRGSVYEDNAGVAIYLAALHSCRPDKLIDLAIAIREGYNEAEETSAIAIKVRPTSTEIKFTVTNWENSFWRGEDYLGKLMDREEALGSPLIASFFHIADHIVKEIPEIFAYLAE